MEMVDKVLPVLVDDITIAKAREILNPIVTEDPVIGQYADAALMPLVAQHE